MRYYRPTIKQPISTFVEAPLDFIQGQMENEQKAIDLGREKALKANEEYLGLRAGMKSKDLLNELKKEYDPQFSNLTKTMMEDPSQVGNVADQIVLLNMKMKQSPRTAAIKDDFEKSQAFAQKTIGMDKGYYMNNPAQLTMGPDGQYQMSTAQDYGILTSKDTYGKIFDDVAKFKPEVYQDPNGTKRFRIRDLDGSYTDHSSTEDVTELSSARIEKYVNEYFNTADVDGSLEFEYRDAAEKEGNPAKAKDPLFRKQVYDNYVAPIINQAYKQRVIKENIAQSNAANTPTRKPNGDPATDMLSVNSKLINNSIDIGVRKANMNVPGTDRVLSSSSDFEEGTKNIYNDIKKDAAGVIEMYKDLNKIPKTQQIDFVKDIYSKYKKDKNGEWIPVDLNNEKDKELLGDVLFKEGLTAYENDALKLRNWNTFTTDLKKKADVNKYDSRIIDNAIEAAYQKNYDGQLYIELQNTEEGQAIVNRKQKNEITNDEAVQAFKELYKSTYNERISKDVATLLSKHPNEQKIYNQIQEYQGRTANVRLYDLPPQAAAVNNFVDLLLTQGDDNSNFIFKNLTTNDVSDVKKIKEGLANLKAQKENGQLDPKSVPMGYYFDPDEGLKGWINIDGTNYEFGSNNTNLAGLIKGLYPQEAYKIDVFNQALKSIENSYGQQGKIDFGDFKFDFKEVKRKDKGFDYEYIDGNGIRKQEKSIAGMLDKLFIQVEDYKKDNVIEVQKELNVLNQLLQDGKIKQEDYDRDFIRLNNKAQEIKLENTKPAGKPQGWNQSPKTPLQ